MLFTSASRDLAHYLHDKKLLRQDVVILKVAEESIKSETFHNNNK